MGKPVAGDVVVIPFPFSDLSGSKRRPALVIAELNGDDLILCMITSQPVSDPYAIELLQTDFETGNLPVNSTIRPSRIFTGDSGLVQKVVGHIKTEKSQQVRERLAHVLGFQTLIDPAS